MREITNQYGPNYVGVSGLVTTFNACEVMRIIAGASTQSSMSGYCKDLQIPHYSGGGLVRGFMFWANAALNDEEIARLKEITEHFEMGGEVAG